MPAVIRRKRLAGYAITASQATAYTAPTQPFNGEATATFRIAIANNSAAGRTVSVWVGVSGSLAQLYDDLVVAIDTTFIPDLDIDLMSGEIIQAQADDVGCTLHIFGVERTVN